MQRSVKVIGRKRERIDEKKLALAFILLAKSMKAQEQPVEAPKQDEAKGA